MSEVQGIDVSHHQGLIDWKKVAESGKKFAIMKCQYESLPHRLDEQFEANYEGCGKYGIKRGVYIYVARASMADIEGDADSLLQHLKGRALEYGIWLDLEDGSLATAGKAYIRELVYRYAKVFKAAGYFVGIYTNKTWYNNLIHDDIKKDFDIWFARYPKNDNGEYNANSSLKPSKDIAVAWQYSSKGKVPGIKGNVDLDVDFDGVIDLVMSTSKEVPKKTIIGSARISEKGTVNGVAGDQKQASEDDYAGEVSLQEFYVHSKGWYILRYMDETIAKKIADAMVRACNNKNIGYSQPNRLQVVKAGTDTKVPADADCSSLVRRCIIEATGEDPGNFTTFDEANMLRATGHFVQISYMSKSDLRVGDILVTKTKGHTAIVTSIEAQQVPSGNPFREPASTVKEGMTGNVIKWVQYQLNLCGYDLKVDGIFGYRTKAAVKGFQMHHKDRNGNALEVDGIVGPLTKGALEVI